MYFKPAEAVATTLRSSATSGASAAPSSIPSSSAPREVHWQTLPQMLPPPQQRQPPAEQPHAPPQQPPPRFDSNAHDYAHAGFGGELVSAEVSHAVRQMYAQRVEETQQRLRELSRARERLDAQREGIEAARRRVHRRSAASIQALQGQFAVLQRELLVHLQRAVGRVEASADAARVPLDERSQAAGARLGEIDRLTELAQLKMQMESKASFVEYARVLEADLRLETRASEAFSAQLGWEEDFAAPQPPRLAIVDGEGQHLAPAAAVNHQPPQEARPETRDAATQVHDARFEELARLYDAADGAPAQQRSPGRAQPPPPAAASPQREDAAALSPPMPPAPAPRPEAAGSGSDGPPMGGQLDRLQRVLDTVQQLYE